MAGQIVGSVIIDDTGAFGYPEVHTTALRIVGIIIAYMGAVTVQFGDTFKTYLTSKWATRKIKTNKQAE